MRDRRSPAVVLAYAALMTAAAGQSFAQAEPPGAARLDPVFACREIADDAARLACFDQAVASLDEQRGSLVVVDRAEIEAVERDSFGLQMPSIGALSALFQGGAGEHAVLAADDGAGESSVRIVERAEDGQVDAVEVAIERVRTVGYDTVRLHLVNGQVWELTESGQRRRLSIEDDSTATIRRAALGSYMLQIDGRGRAHRARRIE